MLCYVSTLHYLSHFHLALSYLTKLYVICASLFFTIPYCTLLYLTFSCLPYLLTFIYLTVLFPNFK